MPQTIHRGIKALIDEANAEIETVSAADAIKAAQGDDVVIVDIRDPREIERDGRIPGAFSCTRGMLEFWIDPASPYAKPIFQERQEVHLPLRGRHAFGAGREDRAGHGPEAGRAYRRRLRRLARRRRSGREVRAEEAKGLDRLPSHAGFDPRVHHLRRRRIFPQERWIAGSSPAMTSDGNAGDHNMTSPTDDPLVSTDWLAAHLDDPKVKIIDASFKMPGVLPLPSDDYLAAHIPGAVFFDVDDDRRSERSAAAYVSGCRPVRARRRRRSAFPPATRLWSTIPAAGSRRRGRGGCSCRSAIANVKVLDGGLKKWRAKAARRIPARSRRSPENSRPSSIRAMSAASSNCSAIWKPMPSSWSMRVRVRVSRAPWPSRGRACAPVTSPAAATCPMPNCSTPAPAR